MFSQGPDQDSRAYPDLLLKIGDAMLEALSTHSQVNVQFVWEELWIIREACKTTVEVGGEKVGLNLARKGYTALKLLAAQRVIGNVAEGTEDPGIAEEEARRLASWRKDNEDPGEAVSP